MTEQPNDDFFERLSAISQKFNEAYKEIEREQEEFWKSLTPDQQLMVFCAISRRIKKGELDQRGTYRYVLYDVFGWGPEAYGAAQMAGYLDIHNALYTQEYEAELRQHTIQLLATRLDQAGFHDASQFAKGVKPDDI